MNTYWSSYDVLLSLMVDAFFSHLRMYFLNSDVKELAWEKIIPSLSYYLHGKEVLLLFLYIIPIHSPIGLSFELL